jgi:hypothetical protein
MTTMMMMTTMVVMVLMMMAMLLLKTIDMTMIAKLPVSHPVRLITVNSVAQIYCTLPLAGSEDSTSQVAWRAPQILFFVPVDLHRHHCRHCRRRRHRRGDDLCY